MSLPLGSAARRFQKDSNGARHAQGLTCKFLGPCPNRQAKADRWLRTVALHCQKKNSGVAQRTPRFYQAALDRETGTRLATAQGSAWSQLAAYSRPSRRCQHGRRMTQSVEICNTAMQRPVIPRKRYGVSSWLLPMPAVPASPTPASAARLVPPRRSDGGPDLQARHPIRVRSLFPETAALASCHARSHLGRAEGKFRRSCSAGRKR